MGAYTGEQRITTDLATTSGECLRPLPAEAHGDPLAALRARVAQACDGLAAQLRLAADAGFAAGHYVRYLSFQHHLTRGVQRHFFTIAGHASLADRRPLREFLVHFAMEEEPHYRVAEADLRAMGRTPLAPPIEVELWWAYFDRTVQERPFTRLGATAVLENLGPGTAAESARLMAGATFLRPENTRFLVIHRHEVLPHGDQILSALAAARPGPTELADLLHGAEVGARLYLGMMQWAMQA